ncbi:MAG: hypothetical protein HMLIMOIP_002377 [Candidatus Nitrosomirales archaeon]|jgi:hypothetical protein
MIGNPNDLEQQKNDNTSMFMNKHRNPYHMEVGAQVPLLCIDSSPESEKAKEKLSSSDKAFQIRFVTDPTEKDSLRPPVLFALIGVFRGYRAIEVYAGSLLDPNP